MSRCSALIRAIVFTSATVAAQSGPLDRDFLKSIGIDPPRTSQQ
jgi:hypothetical protein